MVEKTDFDKFLELAQKEILTNEEEGMLRSILGNHPEWLKDQSKLDKFFPQPVLKEDKNGNIVEMSYSESCGLQKTACMRNVINAAVALNKKQDNEGKPIDPVLSDEDFDQFMNTTGREFAKVVKRNVLANNFKSDAKSEGLRKALQENKESLEKTLKVIEGVKPELLQDEVNNKLNVNEAEAANDTSKTNGLEVSVAETTNDATTTNGLEVSAADTVKIGGGNALTVNAAEKKLNVKPEDETDKKEANIERPPEEDRGHNDFHFDRVKEQDIIDYMFNEWFLASVNFGMEKSFYILDYGLNKIFSARTPDITSQVSAQNNASPNQPKRSTEKLSEIGRFVNNLSFNNDMVQARCEAIIKDIENNIDKNRDPKDWQTETLDPVKSAEFIRKCIQEHRTNPQAFKAKLNDRAQLIAEVAPRFAAAIRAATLYATIEYASDNKNLLLPVSEYDKKAIIKHTDILVKDMMQTQKNLEEMHEYAYRIKHHIEPDVQLDDAAKTQIAQGATMEYQEQIHGITDKISKTKEAMGKFYDAEDRRQASVDVLDARKELVSALGQLGNIPQDKPRETSEQRANTQEQIDLRDAAKEANAAEKAEGTITGRFKNLLDRFRSDKDKSDERKDEFGKKLNGNDKDQSNKGFNIGSFFRNFGKKEKV